MTEKVYKLDVSDMGNPKYTLMRDQYGQIRALRHGEPWYAKNVDLLGDNLTAALLNRIDELEDKVYRLEEQIEDAWHDQRERSERED
jgi:hypothetical protein